MATAVGFRRGTRNENNEFVGVEGELSVNLTDGSVHVHTGDGKKGGYELARKDCSNIDIKDLTIPNTKGKALLYSDLSNLNNKSLNTESITNEFKTIYGLASKDGTNLDTTPLVTDPLNGPKLAKADTSNINTADLAEKHESDYPGNGKNLAYSDLSNVDKDIIINSIPENKFLAGDFSNFNVKVLTGEETAALPSEYKPLAYKDLSNVNMTSYQKISNLVQSLTGIDKPNEKYPSVNAINAVLSTLQPFPNFPEISPDAKLPYYLIYTKDDETQTASMQWSNVNEANNVGYNNLTDGEDKPAIIPIDGITIKDVQNALYTLGKNQQNKANKATTLAGYGITNAYTKLEVDNKLSETVDLSAYATTASVDSKLQTKQNTLNTNQLNAVNSGITTKKVTKYDRYQNQINVKADKTYTDTELNKKLNKNQGVDNSGKVLAVGADGNITLVDTPGGGLSYVRTDNATITGNGTEENPIKINKISESNLNSELQDKVNNAVTLNTPQTLTANKIFDNTSGITFRNENNSEIEGTIYMTTAGFGIAVRSINGGAWIKSIGISKDKVYLGAQPANESNDTAIATTQWTNTKLNSFVNKAGGALTGNLPDINAAQLRNIQFVTQESDTGTNGCLYGVLIDA